MKDIDDNSIREMHDIERVGFAVCGIKDAVDIILKEMLEKYPAAISLFNSGTEMVLDTYETPEQQKYGILVNFVRILKAIEIVNEEEVT